MVIILGALLIVTLVLGIRFLLTSSPRQLIVIFKGLIGACAIIVFVMLILSGRIINVVIGLSLFALFLPIIKNFSQQKDDIINDNSSYNFSDMTLKQGREILNVSESATSDEIKQAYYKIVQKIHPDQGGSNFLTAQVNHAKEILLRNLMSR